MKVFISHQKLDSLRAAEIARRLRDQHQIDSYLDVIDSRLNLSGEDLSEYIRSEMAKCTQLLAVVSVATKASQWVPWEIGVATEKEYPLATFSDTATEVPEFIRRWPILRTMAHVDEYARASKVASRAYVAKRAINLNESLARRSSLREFYTTLRTNVQG